MANRSTLILTSASDYSFDLAGTGQYAWDYGFAVLWFALFEVTDQHLLNYEEDGETYLVPYLATSAIKAREKLQRRKTGLILFLTPSGGIPGLKELEGVIASAQGSIYLDAWEINSLGMEADFLAECSRNVDALNLQPVLEQAYIRQSDYSYKNFGKDGDHPHPYCGYPYNID